MAKSQKWGLPDKHLSQLFKNEGTVLSLRRRNKTANEMKTWQRAEI